MRVGINGMGRIGRLVFRAAMNGLWRAPEDPRAENRLDVVHINELKGGAEVTAHLLEFDSLHGRWRERFGVSEDHTIHIGHRRISFSDAATADGVPWGDLGCDIVLECTGKFLKTEQLDGYFRRGAKRVIVAAPVKEAGALNIVVGVNDHLYEPQTHRLLTAASCTTNCLAPVVKVLHEAIGIRHGQITTIHDPTNTNVVVDAPHPVNADSHVLTSSSRCEHIAADVIELCGDLARLLPPLPEEHHGMTPAFNVLFLCTHNAARSIMAEAILHKCGGDRFRAYSAGSDPIAKPNPEVLKKLRTFGHDTTHLRSKSWEEFTGPTAPRMDFILTLCDTLIGHTCPEFDTLAVTGAWPLPDPAKFTGSTAERATMLNEVYGGLRRRIEIFISLPFASLDRMAMKARLDDIGRDVFAARGGR